MKSSLNRCSNSTTKANFLKLTGWFVDHSAFGRPLPAGHSSKINDICSWVEDSEVKCQVVDAYPFFVSKLPRVLTVNPMVMTFNLMQCQMTRVSPATFAIFRLCGFWMTTRSQKNIMGSSTSKIRLFSLLPCPARNPPNSPVSSQHSRSKSVRVLFNKQKRWRGNPFQMETIG